MFLHAALLLCLVTLPSFFAFLFITLQNRSHLLSVGFRLPPDFISVVKQFYMNFSQFLFFCFVLF